MTEEGQLNTKPPALVRPQCLMAGAMDGGGKRPVVKRATLCAPPALFSNWCSNGSSCFIYGPALNLGMEVK